MTMYLTRFSYTPETWARMVQDPEDRREAARSYIESVGGKLHGFWYAFAIGAGGALRSCETTVLLSVEETMDALRAAKSVRYRPPAA